MFDVEKKENGCPDSRQEFCIDADIHNLLMNLVLLARPLSAQYGKGRTLIAGAGFKSPRVVIAATTALVI